MEDISEGRPRLTSTLMISVIIAVFGGSFQYGYNIAVVNAPAIFIKEYFFKNQSFQKVTLNTSTENQTITSSSDTEYTDTETLLWALTVSIFTVGGVLGSGSVGYFSNWLGRKGALLASNCLSISAGILMLLSKSCNSIVMIIIARFLIGLFAGLSSGLVPLYIAEISPRHLRGALGVVYQLAVTIGILVAQIFGLKEVLGKPDLWNILLALTAVPSFAQLVVLTFMPESPRYLLIIKNQKEAARKALKKFRGLKNVENEIDEMEEETEKSKNSKKVSIIEVLKDKSVRWQVISITILHIVQQLCGINAIFFYLNAIFKAAGVDENLWNYASCIVGAINVFMTIVSVMLIEKAGRIRLSYMGYSIAGLFCILMTISLAKQDDISWLSNLSIAAVIGFIIGFAVGPGPLPWIQQNEFFEQSYRASASAFATGVNWSANFVLALLFPFLQKWIGPYIFLIFFFVCLFGAVFTYKWVPETKNLTFQEISKDFEKYNKKKKPGYNEVNQNIELEEKI